MSAQPTATVKDLRARLELYFLKKDVIENYFDNQKNNAFVPDQKEFLNDNFLPLSKYLESLDEKEILTDNLLDIFNDISNFDKSPTDSNAFKLYKTIEDYNNNEVFIHFSFREGNAKMDLTWHFLKEASEPLLVTNLSMLNYQSFFTNMEKKVMVYNNIKFIPDEYVRPRRGPDGKFYLEIYGEKFTCFSNIDVRTNSVENPLIISIEPRRKIQLFYYLTFNFI